MVAPTSTTLIHRYCVLPLVLCALALPVSAADVYYRYVNDKGVKVLNDSIPPEHAQKGYEVVSLSGEVIRTVAPAPDAEQQALDRANAQVREDFKRLDRRYSSVADIKAAKQRKLDNLETNIAILRGNITGLEAQISNLMKQAADVERSGREVPESILQKLEDTRAELAVAEDLLALREKEYQEVDEQFEQDIANYVKGKQLTKSGK